MCLIYAFLVSLGERGGGWGGGWYFGNVPEIRETKKKVGQQRKSARRRLCRRHRRARRRGCRTRRWRHRAPRRWRRPASRRASWRRWSFRVDRVQTTEQAWSSTLLSLSYLDTPCSSVVSCAGSVNIYPCDKKQGLVLERCLCGWNSAKQGGRGLGFALVEEEEELHVSVAGRSLRRVIVIIGKGNGIRK